MRNAGIVGSNPIGGTITFSSKFERFFVKGRKTQCYPGFLFCVCDLEPTGPYQGSAVWVCGGNASVLKGFVQ